MSKQTYWIADPNGGAKALVEGADQRDLWVGQRGWGLADEAGPGDRVWLYHPETDGRTVLGFEASQGHWKGIGWEFGAPTEPVDTTKDPALMDQPATTTVPPAASSSAASSAATTTTKEK